MSLIQQNQPLSYHEAAHLKKESVWEALNKISLAQAVELFLKTLSSGTADTVPDMAASRRESGRALSTSSPYGPNRRPCVWTSGQCYFLLIFRARFARPTAQS